jgi:fibronectin-binding autotransporter adhesin
MSTKPNLVLARWADLAGSFVTDAPSGLRDTGFVDGTPLAADIVNGELKQLYLWDKWLNDGDCAFHNLSATGTLQATGATTLASTLEVAGTLTCDVGAVIAGAITIGGTLGVTGGTTLTGALAANGGLTVTGTTTALGDLTVGNGHVVTLNGTTTLTVGGSATISGGLHLPARTKILPLAGINTGSAALSSISIVLNSPSALFAWIAIDGLDIGATLVKTRVQIFDNTGPTKLRCGILALPGGTVTNLGTASLGNLTAQTIESTTASFVVVTGVQYYVLVEISTGTATCSVTGAEYDYIPAP